MTTDSGNTNDKRRDCLKAAYAARSKALATGRGLDADAVHEYSSGRKATKPTPATWRNRFERSQVLHR